MLFLLGVVAVSACSSCQITAADIDDDGDMDIMSVLDDKIVWHENLGEDCFTTHVISKGRPRGESDLHLIDVNGDGKLDLLTTFGWFQNIIGRSSVGFCGPFSLDTDSDGAHIPLSKGGIWRMHPADVDGDGDKDIMAAFSVTTEMNPALTPTSRNRQDKLVWFENRDGVFSEQKIISTKPNGLYDTQAGDLDGDGRPDAISVEFSSSRIAMFPNLGQGNWGEAQIVMQAAGSAVTDCGQCIGKGPNAAYVADLNGDGKNDMLFATYPYGGHGGSAVISGSQVGWIENLGGGNWGSPQLINITSGGSINSVSATDVDADGDMDVLVTSSTQGQMLAWFENNGDGTFKELDVISEDAQHSGWVVLADMDGDGDADVLSLHESPDMGHKVEGEAIVWFENLATADNGRPDIAFDKQHKLLICGEEHTEKEALALPAEACPEPTEAPDEDTAMMDSRTLASRLALVVPTVVWFSMS